MIGKKVVLKRFISEKIIVEFTSEPKFTKSPPCPNGFRWEKKFYRIEQILAEWKDFSRHDRMAKNMQPQHAQVAKTKGSWGVGKFYFDVQTHDGRQFRIYFDRAPKDALDREGQWILLAELETPKSGYSNKIP